MAAQPAFGIADLAHRVEELETRVCKLEQALRVAPALSQAEAEPPPELAPDLHLQEAEHLVPLLGKALLALAGAYLLRALTTSSLGPPWVGVGLALCYAGFWMFWATRLNASNAMAGVVFMTTAVLALAPMLWETTVSFHVLPAGGAASAIAAFVIATLLLSWKQESSRLAWLAVIGGVLTALALAIRTDDLLPFCGALLAIAATLEIAAAQGSRLGPRNLAALAADFALLWFVYVYSQPKLPDAYQAIPEVATMLAWVTAAWFASLLLASMPGHGDEAWRAEIRTVLLIASAVLVAVVGRHWHRVELYWLAPGAMVIALYRLISEDFRLGRPETLFLSLLFYGGALLLLSRFMRGWRQA